VEPEARRLGVGDALVRAGLDWMYQQGVHSIEVQVLAGNQGSLSFFESLGFKLELRMLRLLGQEGREGERG
jgi:ribosomal protein S18 acetylase RimI-like enzyme